MREPGVNTCHSSFFERATIFVASALATQIYLPILIIGSVMKAHSNATSIRTHSAFAASALASSHPLLGLPAELITALPEAMLLRLEVPGAPVPVCVWTGTLELGHEACSALPVLAEAIVFDGLELAALVTATSADRLWHADFLGLCFEKWRRPEVRIDVEQALAGANPDPDERWTLARIFTRLGVTLDAVELDYAPISQPLHVAA